MDGFLPKRKQVPNEALMKLSSTFIRVQNDGIRCT